MNATIIYTFFLHEIIIYAFKNLIYAIKHHFKGCLILCHDAFL